MGFLKTLSALFSKKLDDITAVECDQSWVKAHVRLYQDLYKAHLVRNALNVGDKIPITELETIVGEKVDLQKVFEKGPLVLKFHRGSWCNYCLSDLQFFDKYVDVLQSYGATPLSISTQLSSMSTQTAKENNFKFSMVSDADGSISAKFGVAFKLPEEIIQFYSKRLGYNFTDFYNKPLVFSLPATYVIDKQGIVTYAFLDEDFRSRANIEEVVNFVRKSTKHERRSYLAKCQQEENCPILQLAKSVSKRLTSLEKTPSGKGLKEMFFKSKKKQASTSKEEFEKDPLKFCLQTDEFLESFKVFLGKTFCTENLLFFLESSEYQDNYEALTQEERAQEAKRIFETFVKAGSELEVNIDDQTREEIVSKIQTESFEADLFSLANKEVYRLMESDSFTKWRKTRDYSTLWKKSGSLHFLSPVPTFAAAEAA